MADLEVYIEAPDDEWTPCVDGLRFYCWPHRTNHEFKLKDVEKIVYALSAADAHCDAWPPNYGSGHFAPECLMDWLKDERRDAEHVAKSIECREQAEALPPPGHPAREALDNPSPREALVERPARPASSGDQLDAERRGECAHHGVWYQDDQGLDRCSGCDAIVRRKGV